MCTKCSFCGAYKTEQWRCMLNIISAVFLSPRRWRQLRNIMSVNIMILSRVDYYNSALAAHRLLHYSSLPLRQIQNRMMHSHHATALSVSQMMTARSCHSFNHCSPPYHIDSVTLLNDVNKKSYVAIITDRISEGGNAIAFVRPCVCLFPLYLRNRLTVYLELFACQYRSWP